MPLFNDIVNRVAAGFNPFSFAALESYPHAPLFAMQTVKAGEPETQKMAIYCSAGVMTISSESNCSDPGIGTSDHYCESSTRLIAKQDGFWNRVTRFFSGPDIEENAVGAYLVIGGDKTYYNATVPMDTVTAAQSLFLKVCQ